jgi:phage/plasmid-like protein (TIGR03299 family)
MAHNLATKKDGSAAIVFAGETPWHRLGVKVEKAFDAKTALELGGLDFTVEKAKIACADTRAVIPDRFAIRRTDTKDVLGIVTDFYQPLQNREAFAFFDGVFGKDKARYEVAGALGKGERVWLLAKLPGDFSIIGTDTLEKFLLLTNGHDTSEAVRARFTPIRVVCQNTLNAALSGVQSEVRVQHIGDVKGKLEIAGKLLKAAGIYYTEVQTVFRGFVRKQLNAKAVRGYALQVIAGDNSKEEDLSPIGRKSLDRIVDLHDGGRGSKLKGVRGTLWGAYNAVAEYVDHDGVKKSVGFIEHGRGLELKQRAFKVACELATGKGSN